MKGVFLVGENRKRKSDKIEEKEEENVGEKKEKRNEEKTGGKHELRGAKKKLIRSTVRRDIPKKEESVKKEYEAKREENDKKHKDRVEELVTALKKYRISDKKNTEYKFFIFLEKREGGRNIEGVKEEGEEGQEVENEDTARVTIKKVELMGKQELLNEFRERKMKRYSKLGKEELKKMLKKEISGQIKIAIL